MLVCSRRDAVFGGYTLILTTSIVLAALAVLAHCNALPRNLSHLATLKGRVASWGAGMWLGCSVALMALNIYKRVTGNKLIEAHQQKPAGLTLHSWEDARSPFATE